MAGKSQTHENAVLNVMRGTTLTAFSPYIGLLTAAPTDTTTGTEASGGNYARQACTFGAPSGNPASMNNSSAVTWSGVTWSGTVVAWAIYDAVSGGAIRYWLSITSKTVASGDTVQFAGGTLIVTED
jgi:hypothetical protein